MASLISSNYLRVPLSRSYLGFRIKIRLVASFTVSKGLKMWGKKSDDELTRLRREAEKKEDIWNDTGFKGDTHEESGRIFSFDSDDSFSASTTDGFQPEFEVDGEKETSDDNSSGNGDSSGRGSSNILTENERKVLGQHGFDMDKVPGRRLPAELTAGIVFLTNYVEGFIMGGVFGVLVAGNEYYQGQIGRISPLKLTTHVSNQIMKSGHNLGTLVGLYHGAKRLSREYRMDYKEAMSKMNQDTSGVSNDYTTMDSFLGGFVAGMYPSMRSRRSPLRALMSGGGLGLFAAVLDGGMRWSKSLNSDGQQ